MNASEETLPKNDIVLLGAGHTNAHIIRMWRMKALSETRLTCVSNLTTATYSGMVAGTLAGQYHASRNEIDLVRLCAACNVRFIHAQATGLDSDNNLLLLDNRPPLKFDALSIGIGSQPQTLSAEDIGLTIKPMQTFLPRLSAKLQELASLKKDRTLRIAIVGGGTAGVELAFCLPKFIQRQFGKLGLVELHLIEKGSQILSDMPPRAQILAQHELARQKVHLKRNCTIKSARSDCVEFENQETLPVDLLIWATSATALKLHSPINLPKDERGFLLTRNTLQSVGNDSVFAVGDAGTVENQKLAKAGVYAVRQGAILWKNLRNYLLGVPLKKWRPQKTFLTLINSGDSRAIATYGQFSTHARWCWHLKNWIDSRFIDKYQYYPDPSKMQHRHKQVRNHGNKPMPCGGCGCKVSASVLADCLSKIKNPTAEQVLLGIQPPDDAALVKYGSGDAVAATTDFFTAFTEDPYLLGRITALNALNDLYVKGAHPTAALAMAILPPGPQSQQINILDNLLAGAAEEFRDLSVPIVGGHTIEGPKLTFGFTLLGDAVAETVMQKTTPSPTDCLILTKPLGIGILLGAHMRAACKSNWWETLRDTMLSSNLTAAQSAKRLGATAATDVSGFGLAGHLHEMLVTQNLSADIVLESIPQLPGVQELLSQGIESTLAPHNRESFGRNLKSKTKALDPATAILFDPQTSGGLLITINKHKAEDLLTALAPGAAIIGKVKKSDGNRPVLQLSHSC